MRGGFGPRFALEALFLVLVAVIAGLAHLPTIGIILVMFAAWLLTAGIEWAASRGRRAAEASAREPGPSPDVARAVRSAPEVAQTLAAETAAPESVAEGAATPQHVRVIPREPDPAAQPVLERPAPEPATLVDAAASPEAAPASSRARRPVPRRPRRPDTPPAKPPSEPPLPEPADVSPLATPLAETSPPAEEARVERVSQAERAEPTAAEAAEIRSPPVLATAPPSPEPEPERELEPEPQAAGVTPLPLSEPPREWNLWDLERLTREQTGEDPMRQQERSYLLMYLREFARPDGVLPVDFDALVRESFGDLLVAARR